jgi:hypothetical protein
MGIAHVTKSIFAWDTHSVKLMVTLTRFVSTVLVDFPVTALQGTKRAKAAKGLLELGEEGKVVRSVARSNRVKKRTAWPLMSTRQKLGIRTKTFVLTMTHLQKIMTVTVLSASHNANAMESSIAVGMTHAASILATKISTLRKTSLRLMCRLSVSRAKKIRVNTPVIAPTDTSIATRIDLADLAMARVFMFRDAMAIPSPNVRQLVGTSQVRRLVKVVDLIQEDWYAPGCRQKLTMRKLAVKLIHAMMTTLWLLTIAHALMRIQPKMILLAIVPPAGMLLTWRSMVPNAVTRIRAEWAGG